MDVFPKFIIETIDELGDCLIIGKRTYHKELATNITKVKGGGWFSFNKETKTFTLSGDSHDFGKANIEDIKNCINRKSIFMDAFWRRNIIDDFNFNYQNECGENFILKT